MKIRVEITALDFVTNFDKLTGLCIGASALLKAGPGTGSSGSKVNNNNNKM